MAKQIHPSPHMNSIACTYQQPHNSANKTTSIEGKYKFHSEFLDPLSSFSDGYKSESNDANDSKKEDLSQLLCM